MVIQCRACTSSFHQLKKRVPILVQRLVPPSPLKVTFFILTNSGHIIRGRLYKQRVKSSSLIHGDICREQESVKYFHLAAYLTPCLCGLKLQCAFRADMSKKVDLKNFRVYEQGVIWSVRRNLLTFLWSLSLSPYFKLLIQVTWPFQRHKVLPYSS